MTLLSANILLGALFRQPIYVATQPASLLWVLPICLGIALVYKAIKLDDFRPAVLVREVLLLVGTMIGFLALIAVVLLTISQLVRY